MATFARGQRRGDLLRARRVHVLEQRVSLQLSARVLILPELPPQSVFAGVGILAGFAAVVLAADDRDTWIHTTALFGAAGIGALVGARLLWAIGSPEGPLRGGTPWAAMLDPSVPGFWSIGGFVGGGLVALAAVRSMERGKGVAMLDGVVPAGLWTLAVARLGCLSAGCDFGRPTTVPWGIRYPAGTPAWEAHLEQGRIGLEAAASAPTHPFPLYMVGVLLVALAAGRAVRQWRSGERGGRTRGAHAGERALAVLVCYFAGRFAVELSRAPESALELAGTSFTVGQWFSAISIVLLVSVWWTRVGSK